MGKSKGTNNIPPPLQIEGVANKIAPMKKPLTQVLNNADGEADKIQAIDKPPKQETVDEVTQAQAPKIRKHREKANGITTIKVSGKRGKPKPLKFKTYFDEGQHKSLLALVDNERGVTLDLLIKKYGRLCEENINGDLESGKLQILTQAIPLKMKSGIYEEVFISMSDENIEEIRQEMDDPLGLLKKADILRRVYAAYTNKVIEEIGGLL